MESALFCIGNGDDWIELVVVGDGTAGSTVDRKVVLKAKRTNEQACENSGPNRM